MRRQTLRRASLGQEIPTMQCVHLLVVVLLLCMLDVAQLNVLWVLAMWFVNLESPALSFSVLPLKAWSSAAPSVVGLSSAVLPLCVGALSQATSQL